MQQSHLAADSAGQGHFPAGRICYARLLIHKFLELPGALAAPPRMQPGSVGGGVTVPDSR
ncbi:hypothetical protein RV420_200023 [Roseovarius sp. EC-SD190]|nr:hypothetical protein RV420_200023 [Roseovarius sp. EC-SD190]